MHENLPHRLLALLGNGPRSAKELVRLLGVSQPTLSRTITSLKGQVMALGKARAIKYARPRLVKGLAGDFPVHRIDESGNAHPLGTLQALSGGSFWWQADSCDGESRLYDDLPWFLQDMRPDGFVGRAFAHTFSDSLGLPWKLSEWSNEDVLIALSRRGEDHVGNLVVGDESMNRYLLRGNKPPVLVREDNRANDYPELALAAMSGAPAGSSAGGEQPKFLATVQRGDDRRHVLVKFSAATTQAEGQRWADLLHCEHLALELIQQAGINAAKSSILEAGGRVFLEVERFDRCGMLGRCALFSLKSLDAEFVGLGLGWVAPGRALQQAGLISVEDARRMRWLHVFGNLIGNTDMHQGNLSLMRLDQQVFRLAPAYDMLPMLYRPTAGELPQVVFNPPLATMATADVWQSALRAAISFWASAGEVCSLSDDFKMISRANLAQLKGLESAPTIVR